MKKIGILMLLITLFSANSFSQDEQKENETTYKEYLEALKNSTPQIQETDGALVMKFMKKEWKVSKNDTILIFLPSAGKADYTFIEKKKGWISTAVVKVASEVVSTGALAVGLSGNHLGTVIDVMQKADAVYYGADALEKINELKISKNAKKIAGKKAKVLGWRIEDDDYLLDVKIGKKKYQITYAPAIMLNEIKLLN